LVDSTFFTIRVEDKPIAAFTFSPNPPQENILVTFINQSEPTSLYIWAFGDGDTLRTSRRDTLIRHQYPATSTYRACLITLDANGCSDTVCQNLSVLINPLVNVVSAFTPNGDGVNDKAVVFGFGVQRMVFRIFNRWGQLVFESRDPRIGWDGNFKGKPQPMDSYAYTLEADLINGESVRQSGSITLIR
jgi:gliding motility-associated-like protein